MFINITQKFYFCDQVNKIYIFYSRPSLYHKFKNICIKLLHDIVCKYMQVLFCLLYFRTAIHTSCNQNDVKLVFSFILLDQKKSLLFSHLLYTEYN